MTRQLNEAGLLADVIDLCGKLGLLYHHCPAAYRCEGQRGFPDLVIAGPKGVILAELKGPDTDTTAEQDEWLWTLDQATGAIELTEYTSPLASAVWRPADLTDGTIRRELESLA